MIRIFSKKTFAIGPGAQRGTSEVDYFLTVPFSFQDMPEKYSNDPTFLMACKAGDITVVESKPTIMVEPTSVVEKEPATEEVEEVPETESEEDYKERLRKMNKEEVQAEAEKYGAEFLEEDKLSANKKRVLEAYKLTLA